MELHPIYKKLPTEVVKRAAELAKIVDRGLKEKKWEEIASPAKKALHELFAEEFPRLAAKHPCPFPSMTVDTVIEAVGAGREGERELFQLAPGCYDKPRKIGPLWRKLSEGTRTIILVNEACEQIFSLLYIGRE